MGRTALGKDAHAHTGLGGREGWGVSPGADIYFCGVLGRFPNLSEQGSVGTVVVNSMQESAGPLQTHVNFLSPRAWMQGGRGAGSTLVVPAEVGLDGQDHGLGG